MHTREEARIFNEEIRLVFLQTQEIQPMVFFFRKHERKITYIKDLEDIALSEKKSFNDVLKEIVFKEGVSGLLFVGRVPFFAIPLSKESLDLYKQSIALGKTHEELSKLFPVKEAIMVEAYSDDGLACSFLNECVEEKSKIALKETVMINDISNRVGDIFRQSKTGGLN